MQEDIRPTETLSDASSRIDGGAQCKDCLNSALYRVFTCIHCQSHHFTTLPAFLKMRIPAFVQANRATGDSWRSKSKLNTTGSWSQDLRKPQVSPQPQVPSESSKSKATAKLEEARMELQAELGKKAKAIEAGLTWGVYGRGRFRCCVGMSLPQIQSSL